MIRRPKPPETPADPETPDHPQHPPDPPRNKRVSAAVTAGVKTALESEKRERGVSESTIVYECLKARYN